MRVLAWAWLAAAGAALAAPVDGGSRIQRYRYDAETSFAILALPGVPTDLQLAPDEHVTGFALGDTLQWMVEELPGHVFIKPLKSDLFTAGTLVTDRRTYQLTLRSGHAREDWMQRVSWSYPALVTLRAPVPAEASHDAEVVAALPSVSEATPGAPARRAGGLPAAPGVDPAQLDFGYRVQGSAAFRPDTVFDDGHATWIRIPRGQVLPALYADGGDGEQLVAYAVRSDWMVAPRLASAWVLRAGRAEVRLQRHPEGERAARTPPPGFWR